MYLLIVQDQSCTDVSVKYRNWQLFPLSTVEKMTLTDSRHRCLSDVSHYFTLAHL